MAKESIITVFRSTSTDTPTGLTFGELAYSDLNGKLFIGKNNGASLWIGAGVTDGSIDNNGQYLVPTQSAVKSYVDGAIGGGSGVVNTVNATGGAVTITGDGGAITNVQSGKDNIIRARLADNSLTGVASFSSSNFDVVSGAVSIKAGGVTNGSLQNSSVTVSAGTGLGGGGSVALGSTVTLTNLGVLSLNGLTGDRTITGDGGAIIGANNNTITTRLATTGGATGVAAFASDNFAITTSGEVSIKNGGVDNAELANSSITIKNSVGDSGHQINLGEALTIEGTTNEIEITRSTHTFTVGLPNDVTITGNLTVNGTVVTNNVETYIVEDPLIVLGTGNTSDSVDIGFYGKYSATNYTGLFRDSDDKKFKLFAGLTEEPSTTVNTGGAGYAMATLVARIDGGTF